MDQPLDLLDVANAQYDLQASSEALFDRMCFLQVETRAGGLVLAESTCAQGPMQAATSWMLHLKASTDSRCVCYQDTIS